MKELYVPKSFITFNHYLFKEGQQIELNGYERIVKHIHYLGNGKLSIEAKELE